jgi:hypothetical protein
MFLLDLLECWSGCQIAGWVFVMVFTWAHRSRCYIPFNAIIEHTYFLYSFGLIPIVILMTVKLPPWEMIGSRSTE